MRCWYKESLENVFGSLRRRPGQMEEALQRAVDLLAKPSGVRLVVEALQRVLLVSGQYVSTAQPLKRSLSWAMATAKDGRPILAEADGLVFEAQDGLKEVIVQPELVIEVIESPCLRNRIEALVAEVGSDQG